MSDRWRQRGSPRWRPTRPTSWRAGAFDWTLSGLKGLRRELRRVTDDSAPRILAQQEAVADQLEAVLRRLPEPLLRAPGAIDSTATRRHPVRPTAMGLAIKNRP